MTDNDDVLERRIATKTDKELVEIAAAPERQYAERTLQLVWVQITSRGGYEALYKAAFGKEPDEIPLMHRAIDTYRAEDVLVVAGQAEHDAEPPASENIVDTPTPAPKIKRLSGTRVLKEESILSQWQALIRGGAGHREWVLNATYTNLKLAKLPLGCTTRLQEVRSSGIFQRVYRDFLIASWEQFPDHHIYIGIRDFGAHLHCCWYLAVEPDLLTKWVSKKMTGLPLELSAPKNILIDQDLSVWTSVVHRALLDAVDALMEKLGQNPATLNRGSKGFLEVW